MKTTMGKLTYILVLFTFLSGCSLGKKTNVVSKPNIVLILSDDMGYSDLGCYGGEIETPSLDKLASNGIRFTQFYNSGRCCPTRASLMTGLYPQQTGIGHMTNSPENPDKLNLGISGYEGSLNDYSVTLAQMLKLANYNTLMTGKWHLGIEFDDMPLQRGFDKFYGIVPGASNFFKPKYPRGITYMNDTITVTEENYYTTDAFTDKAIEFIKDTKSEDKDNPFFLYLAYTAPHFPIQAPEKDIAKYRGKYMNGWEPIRQNRYQKMKAMGLIDSKWKLSEQDAISWDSLSEEKQKEMDYRMAIYAAMVDRMDQNIGRLIKHLENSGELDNTIIIFLNDNGACAEKDELGTGSAKLLGTDEGYLLTYGKAWANASNTPYRKYKRETHEGGIATPMIIHWPNGIDVSNRGKFVKNHAFLPDIMATFLDLSSTEYPKSFKGNKIHSLVGKSFVPTFNNIDYQIHSEPIFFEHIGNKAVRDGKYKLVSSWNRKSEFNWELYDMEKDRTEVNNLASEMPEKVEEMGSNWMKWADSVGVKPWGEVRQRYRDKNRNKNKN